MTMRECCRREVLGLLSKSDCRFKENPEKLNKNCPSDAQD